MNKHTMMAILLGDRPLLPFSMNFSAIPDGTLPPNLLGATWTVASGKALCTPVTLVANSLTNGNMETGNPPSSWNANAGSTLTGAADERTGGAGAQSLNVARGTNNSAGYQGRNGLAGWNIIQGWARNVDATSVWWSMTGGTGGVTPAVTGTSWAYGEATLAFYTGSLSGTVRPNVNGTAGQQGRFDDVATYGLTASELMALLPATRKNVTVKASWTVDASRPAGIVVRANSQTNPTAFVHICADRNGAVIRVDTHVSGTVTSVSATSFTYVAGATIECRVNGTTYETYYNNALIKTDTIDNAALNDNKHHGLMSTGGTSRCDAFFCL